MSKRTLELEVMKGSAHVARFEVTADPDDVPALQDSLTGWLEGDGWKRSRWDEFRLLVRRAGEYRILKTVRAPSGRP